MLPRQEKVLPFGMTFTFIWNHMINSPYSVGCKPSDWQEKFPYILESSMSQHPFDAALMEWLIVKGEEGWGITVVAAPPPVAEVEEYPYVMGNLERAMPTLAALVEGARNPRPTMLPVRLVMRPNATVYSRYLIALLLTTLPSPSPAQPWLHRRVLRDSA